jgi:TRAP-type mannitol/chloroaromatic compound transport system permease large subunit
MMAMGASAGLWMLLALGVLIVMTGLPVWALLIGVASAFAAIALLAGTLDVAILAALPARMVGLLEHDLLQALPLYVFIGVLLQRLTVADVLFSTLKRFFRRTGASGSLAALSVGTLIAPMNGSVASSSALLARLVAPRLGKMNAAGATALISVAATIGVVVPPSLVLILLGDAMLRAHTEASNLPGFVLGEQRIVNTQDVFNAALLPALCVLLLWTAVAWWQGRKFKVNEALAPVKWAQAAISFIAILIIFVLLGAVFSGKMFAVEAAATGGVVLILVALASRALSWPQWRVLLADTLSLSGALFALLVGASTFSLIFRLLGTDRWIAELVLNSVLSPQLTSALVLLAVALCAWVLDAFEMIFVIIPIVAPALIAKLGDAQQTAVLLLLVLQLSFLIPPMGYAVLMARARAGLGQVAMPALLKALLPFILVQCAVTAIVFVAPWTVHQLDAPVSVASDALPMSAQDIEKQMHDMAQQDEAAEPQLGRPEQAK